MQHDLVIRDGLIVDGSGAAPFAGDIAIAGDRIVEIGCVTGRGREEIRADGRVVSPGFIDLHTHLDAQIGWDPTLTPVTWHGVTTALLGNCGVTFAPCRRADREFLAAMMETVEDIPRGAILEGLSWNWETYGEYLDELVRLRPAINVGGLVGHCATRLYVMGERGIDERAGYTRGWTPINRPTAEEVARIAEVVGQSVRDGALGFSTNRLPGHRLPDGRSIPGTFAHRDELRAIARAIGPWGGMMQTVTDYKELDEEMQLIADEARLCRAALFSANEEAGVDEVDAKVKAMRAEGLNVHAVTVPRSGGGLLGLASGNTFSTPAWRALRPLDLPARLAAIREPQTRARLVEEARAAVDERVFKAIYWLGNAGDVPDYMQPRDRSLHALARAAGEHPIETFLRLSDASNGSALFNARGFNINHANLRRLLETDWVVPIQGDAGAHVSQMVDAGVTTFLLAHWHRNVGAYSLQEAVRRITSMPATVLGLADRGTLAVGKRADINVFDVARLAERMPELVSDFPTGARRYIQRGTGYAATICNGAVILRDDELTGARAGCVLRSQPR